MRARELLVLGGILLLGLGLRVLYLRELLGAPDFSAPVIDPGFHDYWARALATGDWTPPENTPDPLIRTTPFFRPPGYAYFLALIYKVAGPGYLAPRIIQMGLGLLNCVLAFLLGRRWYGRSVALIFAGLMATYWVFIYFEGEFLEPVLLIFLLLSFVYTLSQWSERTALRHSFAAGLLLGLAALVRPNALLFLPVGLAWTWWIAYRRRKGPRTWAAGLGLVLGALLAVAPASVRNYRAAQDIVLISSNLGINLLIANHENADGLVEWEIPGFGRFHTCYEYPAIVANLEKEVGQSLRYSDASAYYAREAVRSIRRHPLRFIELIFRRALLFWGPAEISHNKEIDCERTFSGTLRNIPGNFPFVLALFLLGIVRLVIDVQSAKRNRPGSSAAAEGMAEVSVLIVSFILTYFASYLPFVNAALYRVPVIPFLLLFGAYGVFRIGQFVRDRDVRRSMLWVLLGGCLYLLAGRSFTPYRAPGPAVWHGQRAKMYLSQGKLDHAVKEAHEALRLAPGSVDAHSVLALALSRQGRKNEAMEHEAEALRLSGPDPERHMRLGTALCEEGRIEQGMTHLREALRLDPTLAEAHANLAIALKLQGDFAEAARELREAIRLQPDDPRHRERLGVALCQQGKIEEGIEHFREALRIDPAFAEAHASLAVALKLRGEIAEAIEEARHALRLEPHQADRHLLLADLLLHEGRLEEAVSECREALRINPHHLKARKSLDRALAKRRAGSPE